MTSPQKPYIMTSVSVTGIYMPEIQRKYFHNNSTEKHSGRGISSLKIFKNWA